MRVCAGDSGRMTATTTYPKKARGDCGGSAATLKVSEYQGMIEQCIGASILLQLLYTHIESM